MIGLNYLENMKKCTMNVQNQQMQPMITHCAKLTSSDGSTAEIDEEHQQITAYFQDSLDKCQASFQLVWEMFEAKFCR